MSFFVTRPSRPVPVTPAGSMPCSAAIRATTGETKAGRPVEEPLPLGAGASGAAATGSGSGSGAAAASGST